MPKNQLPDEWDLLYEAIQDQKYFCTDIPVCDLPLEIQLTVLANAANNGIFPPPAMIQLHRPSGDKTQCAYCRVRLVSTAPS